MAGHQEKILDLNAIDFEQVEATNDGINAVKYCVYRLQEAMNSPNLQSIVEAQMKTCGLIPQVQKERARSLE